MTVSLHSIIFAVVISVLMLFGISPVNAEDNRLDIEEIHTMLEKIQSSEVPDEVKQQMIRDIRTTLIEKVRQSDLPEETRNQLIKDLEATAQQ